jgi:hypothetical protein
VTLLQRVNILGVLCVVDERNIIYGGRFCLSAPDLGSLNHMEWFVNVLYGVYHGTSGRVSFYANLKELMWNAFFEFRFTTAFIAFIRACWSHVAPSAERWGGGGYMLQKIVVFWSVTVDVSRRIRFFKMSLVNNQIKEKILKLPNVTG